MRCLLITCIFFSIIACKNRQSDSTTKVAGGDPLDVSTLALNAIVRVGGCTGAVLEESVLIPAFCRNQNDLIRTSRPLADETISRRTPNNQNAIEFEREAAQIGDEVYLVGWNRKQDDSQEEYVQKYSTVRVKAVEEGTVADLFFSKNNLAKIYKSLAINDVILSKDLKLLGFVLYNGTRNTYHVLGLDGLNRD